jgi:NADPH:quinone reductase
MRAVRFHEYGDESVLRVDDVEQPAPAAGQVRVRVRAASVNPVDTKLREGVLEPTTGLPHVAGVDLAGVVDAVGDGVTEFETGDRVYGTGFGWTDHGTYAEYAAVPADRLGRLPETVSFNAGAAAPMVYATAWYALRDCGDLAVGDVCLVHGAAGGVGHAGVQIASAAGATVVGTARPGKPTAAVEADGGVPVDYRSETLVDDVREVTGGCDVDVVLEPHLEEHVDEDLKLLASGGCLSAIAQGDDLTLTPAQGLAAMVNGSRIEFMSMMAAQDEHARLLNRIGPLLADGALEPRIAARYPLAEAADAQAHAMSSGVVGKVVIDVSL